MGKMFKCEDRKMFSIDDVVSVEEASKSQGFVVLPQGRVFDREQNT